MSQVLGFLRGWLLGAALLAPIIPSAVAGVPPTGQAPNAPAAEEPQSRAERTRYEETSSYADVVAFFDELARRSPLLRLTSFGRTVEGRELLLAIMSDPPVAQPREAAALGRPVVFVMANIHAGEVEGKEALQQLARRLLLGDLRPLLERVVILFAPVYNADGNEAVSLDNRPAQNGPIGGVGARTNAQGLDLNRDYIKLESPEATALVALFNTWDPHLTVDLHTTNGSYHGYHLTYSIPLNPTTDPRILSYHRETMMPALTRALAERHRVRAYYYGNFYSTASSAGGDAGARGGRGEGRRGGARGDGATTASAARGGAPGNEEPRAWMAFSPAPRVGQNYVGLRNRLTILSEAYSYLDFRGRIEATAAFVEEIVRYAADRGPEIMELTRRCDADAMRRSRDEDFPLIGLAYEPKALPEPVELLVGEVTRVLNPRSGREMLAALPDRITPVRVIDYGLFEATRTIRAARWYAFADTPTLRPLVAKLRAHGIAVERLTAPFDADIESFVVAGIEKNPRAFQGHNEVTLSGAYRRVRRNLPAGTIVVRTAQPLGTLAAYLLEPESDDGFTRWNFLDAVLEPNAEHPVYRGMVGDPAPTRAVDAAE